MTATGPEARSRQAASPSEPSATGQTLFIWSAVLLAGAISFYIYAASIGWTDEVGGPHNFRQTQTAMSCFYMLRQPLVLAYETPVLGPPWAIPMEFPLYQWLVVLVVKIFGTPLAEAGRFVGVALFLASLVPVYYLLDALRVARPHRLLFLAVLAVSPFYIFWSRTFMIETTALFFSTCYLACGTLALQRNDKRLLAVAAAAGVLAGLVKITTFLVFIIPVGVYCAALFVSRPFFPWEWRRLRDTTVRLVVLVGLPLVFGILWTRFADGVKQQNALGQYLTSAHLSTWNFGTVAQRLSIDTWRLLLERATTLVTADKAFWLSCALVPIVTRRRWKEVLACVALFVAGPLLFTNLHVVHDYYMCANGIFLLAAIGFCVVAILESAGGTRAGIAAVLLTMLLAFSMHRKQYLPIQKQDNRGLAKAIKERLAATDPEAVTIYLGLDWSPVWPYHAERRALMIPEWGYVKDADVRQALANLKGHKIGPILSTGSSRYTVDKLLKEMEALGLDTSKVEKVQ